MRAQLIPLDGGPPLELTKDLTLVGRKEDCDLRLDHKSVSKQHCVLVKSDGVLLVRDLGSTNGTRVNGQRIRRAALLPNDQLTIANLHYRILLGGADASAAAAPDEHTVRMDEKDVSPPAPMPKKSADPMGDSSADIPVMEIQANALPDKYEE